MSIGGWTDKQNVLHTYDGLLSALARKEDFLPHAATRMKLDKIKLRETRQSQKDKFHLYEVSKVLKFIEKESKIVVMRDWEGEVKESCCLKEIEF